MPFFDLGSDNLFIANSKAHRYDLNQISYYIEANEDYILFYGDSYPGNMHDSKTGFIEIVNLIGVNS